jgi:hypothetical protein
MTVFNGERFLREAVESILAQGFRDFDFIVIDDGSTDGSASLLDSYQKLDARLRVYHDAHAGLIRSLNRGSKLVRGKYLARMDADDVAKPDRLARQVDVMESHPQLAALGGAVEWIDAQGRSLGIYPNPTESGDIHEHLLRGFCAFWHPTMLIRQEAFSWAGGYRNGVVGAEDLDLWLRLADRYQLANLPEVLLRYRIHAGQESVCKRRQQTLSNLAARASAACRRKGMADPLDAVTEITPATLVALGVTEAAQQAELVADSQKWIDRMGDAGEYPRALATAQEVLDFDLRLAERWQIANLHLTVARLHWRQGRFLKSFLALSRALVTRPAVAGRPLKALFRRRS